MLCESEKRHINLEWVDRKVNKLILIREIVGRLDHIDGLGTISKQKQKQKPSHQINMLQATKLVEKTYSK